MIINKKKINLKVVFYLLQFVVMAFLFVVLADKQTILLIRDFIDSIGIDANIQTILARLYASFKLLFNLPSCFGLMLFAVQIFCAAKMFEKLVTIIPERIFENPEKIDQPEYKIDKVLTPKKLVYLENSRLLN